MSQRRKFKGISRRRRSSLCFMHSSSVMLVVYGSCKRACVMSVVCSVIRNCLEDINSIECAPSVLLLHILWRPTRMYLNGNGQCQLEKRAIEQTDRRRRRRRHIWISDARTEYMLRVLARRRLCAPINKSVWWCPLNYVFEKYLKCLNRLTCRL